MGVTGEEDTEQVEKPRAEAEHRRGEMEERKCKNEEREFWEAQAGEDKDKRKARKEERLKIPK